MEKRGKKKKKKREKEGIGKKREYGGKRGKKMEKGELGIPS